MYYISITLLNTYRCTYLLKNITTTLSKKDAQLPRITMASTILNLSLFGGLVRAL